MSEHPVNAERSTGIYSWLSMPWVYDFCQRLIRSQASRSEFFRKHIRPVEGMRVLDVGCGTGDALQYLKNVTYLGIDRNEAYITAAKKRWGRPADFICGDVSTISELKLGQFDVVFCLGVLHHLDDAAVSGLLHEISSILTPHGRFISHDPVYVESQSRAAQWIVSRDRGQFVRTPEAIQNLAKSSFPSVKSCIDFRPLRIPYTEIIMECSGSR